MRENIRHKRSDKLRNNSWALHHYNAPAHASLVRQFLASTKMTVILHPPYSQDLTTWFFPIPEDENEAQGVTFWQQWRDQDRIRGRVEDAEAK
jgi:hypothetical protein